MSSSNNNYNNGSNSAVFPLSLYLSSLSGHQGIPYNHQSSASPGQMVSAVPESLINYMPFSSNSAMNQQGLDIPEVSREIKKAVKKDRHSKIHTAQGLRDRRVRLSIGISRQFFDLQDMLGFDKASKTLDWLLKKSRRDIEELVQEKKLYNNDEDFGNNGGNLEKDDDVGDTSFVYGSCSDCFEEVVCKVKKPEKRNKKTGLSNISSSTKRSRTKARGKAKEKAREIISDHPETTSKIIQTETSKRSINFNGGEDMTDFFYKESIQESANQECITKIQVNLPMNMDQSYNQQYPEFMLKDQGSSSNYYAILPQNLDFDYNPNPFIDQLYCGVTNTNFFRGFP